MTLAHFTTISALVLIVGLLAFLAALHLGG